MNNQLSTKKLSLSKFNPIQNREYFSKPNGGFWTSSLLTNGKSDWVEWCERNEPGWLNGRVYEYEVLPTANILHVTNGISKYIFVNNEFPGGITAIDFEQMIADGYDGLHFNHDGDWNLFYGWDVESTVWFNPNVLRLVS